MEIMTKQELATVLAALRWYQDSGFGDPTKRTPQIHQIASDLGKVLPLGSNEIDDLCEKLNR